MSVASRVAFGNTLAELGGSNPNIVALDADLAKSTMSGSFAEKFPDRFFDMGIAEANMIGTAAGMALSGKIPFICSFACFLTGRFDQIRISVGYTGAPVRLVGTHSGIAIGPDGYSQMGTEDIALMRSLPEMKVFHPVDANETKQIVSWLCENTDSPAYLRLTRQGLEDLTGGLPGYKFEMGKGVVLREGTDLAIFATGGVVGNSIKAAENLAKNGIQARVVNIHTIRPIDKELVIDSAKKCGKVITVEDHQITGGLGEEIATVLSENQPTLMKRIGVRDQFGESGSPEDLYKKYQLDVDGITTQIQDFMKA